MICGYAIRVYDIKSSSSNIDIQIDGGEIITVYTGYSAHQYGSMIFSLHLVSKDTSNGTAIIDMVVSDNPCNSVSCSDICVGNDLYSQRCRIEYDSKNVPTGNTSCIQNILKNINDPLCLGTANMYIEFYVRPPSNKTISEVYSIITGLSSSIASTVVNVFSGISGVTYINSVIIEEPSLDRVTYRVNYHDDNISTTATRLIAPIVIPLWLLVTLIGGLLITSGLLIYGYFFSEKTSFTRSQVAEMGKDITNRCVTNCENSYPNWKTNTTEYTASVTCVKNCNKSVGDTLADSKYLNNPQIKIDAEETNAEMQKWVDCLNAGTCNIDQAVAGFEQTVTKINNNYNYTIETYKKLDACFNIPFVGCFNTNELVIYGIIALSGVLVVSSVVSSSNKGSSVIIERDTYREPYRNTKQFK